MLPWILGFTMIAVALLIGRIIPIIFNHVYKLIFKKELPYPLPIAITTIMGVIILYIGIAMIVRAEKITISTIIFASIPIITALGMFGFVFVIIKGIAYLEYFYSVSSHSYRYKIIFRREHQRKADMIFIGYICLLVFLMLLGGIIQN